MAAVAAAQTIPPMSFNLPLAQNNAQLSVAFNQMTGAPVVVQPGVLFGKQSEFPPHLRKFTRVSMLIFPQLQAHSPLLPST